MIITGHYKHETNVNPKLNMPAAATSLILHGQEKTGTLIWKFAIMNNLKTT